MNGIIKQKEYPSFIITFNIANSIVDILVEHCKVAANKRKTIVNELMWLQPTEYLFQDNLGSEGKLVYQNDKLYIDYHSKDKTNERELKVKAANIKLEKLYKENKYV